MNTFSHVPPGFRFHPTDEELVDYYLRKKVSSRRIDLDVIKDVDLYKIEPWDLQELCRIGTEEQHEWYFFSHKDKKYPTGTRTNRATAAGFWKATGRDKAIYAKHDLIGMRKTLVFYKGRAPNGQKSDWIMHEYRLETDENGAPQEEGWVVCRVFKKRMATLRKVISHENESPIWYDDQVSFMPEMDSPLSQLSTLTYHNYYHYPYYMTCKKETDHHLHHDYHHQIPQDHHHFLQLPLLETTPKLMLQAAAAAEVGMMNNTCKFSSSVPAAAFGRGLQITQDHNNYNALNSVYSNNHIININHNDDEHIINGVTDWRVLDKFVASQLSQEEVVSSKENHDCSNDATNNNNNFHASDDTNPTMVKNLDHKQELMAPENASTSSSSCQIDLWK